MSFKIPYYEKEIANKVWFYDRHPKTVQQINLNILSVKVFVIIWILHSFCPTKATVLNLKMFNYKTKMTARHKN